MKVLGYITRRRIDCGFSLIEVTVVMAIIIILMSAGVSLLRDTSAHDRKSATDFVIGMVEQARTEAITRRGYVVLAMAEPGDLGSEAGHCCLGLFHVGEWPDDVSKGMDAVLLFRWKALNHHLVLLDGSSQGLPNPMDSPEVTLNYDTGEDSHQVKVNIMAFTARGGLHYPAGSSPVVLRLAEGGYRGGKASANRKGDDHSVSENLIKIGRVIARPYPIDG